MGPTVEIGGKLADVGLSKGGWGPDWPIPGSAPVLYGALQSINQNLLFILLLFYLLSVAINKLTNILSWQIKVDGSHFWQ